MTFSAVIRLTFICLLGVQPAIGSAAAAYWLPESHHVEAAIANLSGVAFDTLARPGANWNTPPWAKQPGVDRWADEASRLIIKYRVNPLRSVRMLALLHVAMHDAGLRAKKLALGPYAQSAAIHAAASEMLAHFFPLESPGRFEAMGESSLAALMASQPQHANQISTGALVGRSVARLAVLRALNDGADEVWDARTRPPAKPGSWRGAPPLDSAHPQEPLAGTWRTWVIKDGGEFLPPPPPPPGSDAFLLATQEVLEISRNLTAEQKRIAAFWHLDQGTVTPPGLWNLKARELAGKWKLTDMERLRLLSALNVAMMDASIACWHTKYAWWVQRPITTIHAQFDKTFMPYLVTPPHPSYVSGHATVSAAAAEILKHFFPDDARQIDNWAQEAAMSRLYGGIHYRFDNEAGLDLGRRVGKAVLEKVSGQSQSK